MKNLVLGASIALAASQAAGCIISSGDSGNDAFITANWTLKSIASGTTASCPPGFDTAALYSQQVDSNGNKIGSAIIDLFNCDANTGTSAALPPGIYDVFVVIANHDNTSQYAESLTQTVDITAADKSFAETLYVDGGYFSVGWNLTKASNGAALLCSDVAGIGGVEAISTDVSNSSNSASDIFPCEDHVGVTGGFRNGTYTVHVDAINTANPPQSIGDAPDLLNKVIGPTPQFMSNTVNNLGTVNVPITAL
jgi:hypothetical protein